MTDGEVLDVWDDEGDLDAPLARPRLDFIWVLDRSSSMAGERMVALNTAIREAIPVLRQAADNNPHVEIVTHALAFSTEVEWLVTDRAAEDLRWIDLEADGYTNMGAALAALGDKLEKIRHSHADKIIPPVVVLMSDGYPTDDFADRLDALLSGALARKAIRLAVAIGRDADKESLSRFIDNDHIEVFQANNPYRLMQFITWASTLVSEGSQTIINQGALSERLADINDTSVDRTLGDPDEDAW